VGFVLAERASLHRGVGGSGGVAVGVVPPIEGWLEADCRLEGGTMCVARSSGRLAAVSVGGRA
jgi:hypothetical protein